MTDLEVLTTAITDAAVDRDALRWSIKLLGSIEASGIAVSRYRTSRDPADASAARRWLELGKEAEDALDKGVQAPRFTKLLNAIHPSMARFDRALGGIEAATVAFEREAPDVEACRRQPF